MCICEIRDSPLKIGSNLKLQVFLIKATYTPFSVYSQECAVYTAFQYRFNKEYKVSNIPRRKRRARKNLNTTPN